MNLRIGIVGTGETVGIAHYHALGLLRDGRASIAAVYDLKRENAEKFVAEHGLDAVVCDSFQQLLELTDAVDICTPNHTHIPYLLEAVRAGKGVLVEKPLSVSAAHCTPVLEALARQPVFNMVGFIYRFTSQLERLRELIKNDIGRVYTYSASFGGKRLADPTLPLEWRMRRQYSGSGALGDFGSHLLDSAFYAAGLTFREAAARSQTFIPRRQPDQQGNTLVENDDAAVMIAKAQNNALASFVMSRVGMDAMQIFVTGEGGLARVALWENEKIYYSPKAPAGGYSGGVKEIETKRQTPFDDWFCGEMTGFVDGLLGKRGDLPDVAHAAYIEGLLEQADAAAQEGVSQ